MKKILAIILASIMLVPLVSVAFSTVTAAETEDAVVEGDSSSGGAVSIIEAISKFFNDILQKIFDFILRILHGKPTDPKPTEPTTDPEEPDVVVTPGDNLKEIIEAALPGETVIIGAGEYPINTVINVPHDVTILGKPGSVIKLDGSYAGSRAIIIDGSDVTIDGVTLDCSGKSVKGIFATGTSKENIVVRNNTVLDCGNDAVDLGNCISPVVTGNYIDGIYDNGVRIGNHISDGGNPAVVSGNTIQNGSAVNGSIWIEGGQGDIIISDNTIRNIVSIPASGSDIIKGSAIHIYEVYNGGVITIENNTIDNCDRGIAVYKFVSKNDGDKVTVKNNTITNSGVFDTSVKFLNYDVQYNPTVSTLVEIIDSGARAKFVDDRDLNGFNFPHKEPFAIFLKFSGVLEMITS
ncbi:MAG: right-handed parallel beta-helix repeat-containing protein [Oscillospiraceae bacterium]|nr:right-handed parallel beta-helix repeat-containing protein [Oscillospiraceae bacterium]